MTTRKKHQTIVKDQINIGSFNVEQRLRQAIAALPKEQTITIDVSKVYQQLIESFYAYECHLTNFVFDRDMHYIIYSLGLVPTQNEMNQLILGKIFFANLLSLFNLSAMRFHPQSRTAEREELDDEHHLIHISDFAEIIIPKLLHNEYQPANEEYLLKCFHKLDQNKKHYLHKKLFIQTLSTMEDALDENESNDLLNFLMKNQSLTTETLPDFFHYKRYMKHLLPQRHLVYLNLGLTK